MRGGTTPGATYTVRRTGSWRRCRTHLPTLQPEHRKVEVLRNSKVRRSQLYYLRDLQGKAARLKEKRFLQV